ncbi:Probable amino acid permease 7, partial [Linum perenne]
GIRNRNCHSYIFYFTYINSQNPIERSRTSKRHTSDDAMDSAKQSIASDYDDKSVAFLQYQNSSYSSSSSSYAGHLIDDDPSAAAGGGHEEPVNRSGTVWTAVAHIITAVIGSGVLSLQWSMAQLGWIAGPAAMMLFAAITLLSAFLLCDCYRSPHYLVGPSRNRSYLDAVLLFLGRKNAWACGVLVQTSMYGIGIAYTITSAISMSIYNSNKQGESKGWWCESGGGMGWYMVAFGVLELLMSQIPNFHDIQWLSNVAAVMSFAYSFIGFGLGFSRVLGTITGNGEVKGTITGIRAKNGMDKMWKVSQALGDIAFAYPYSLILIEIQDTLKSPPSETVTMKKASTAAIIMTTFFYLCCSGFGYAAFGEDTPGNLLTGFHQPFWLINFAHVCIIFHLLGGYQVYSQPIFANAEKWFSRAYPDNVLVRQESSTYRLKVPAAENRYMEVNLMRLFFRTVYVATTTGIAMMFPYFNEVIGVLGGFMYWPVSIYFPVEMYLRQRDVEAWTIKWALLRIFSVVCLFLICFALVGSVRGLVVAHSG